MQILKSRLSPLLDFLHRHPWLMALYGFVSGAASFFLVNRQQRLAGTMGLVLLVGWVWLVLENSLSLRSSPRLGKPLPTTLLRYATQFIHQESLFFVLPFFMLTTRWQSGQALFTGLLALAALISILDPLYDRLLQSRWGLLALHLLALFALALTALPILLHLTTSQSYRLALWTTLLFALPSLARSLWRGRWWRGLLLVVLTLAVCGGLWLGRFWVPPATLWMTQVAISKDLDDQRREPGPSIRQISATELQHNGLYAYTAIKAPRGLAEPIEHRWLQNGELVDRISLEITGGRREGYRAWTHKNHFPADAVGHWQIQVVTEAGQVIGQLQFEVVAAEPASATLIAPENSVPQ